MCACVCVFACGCMCTVWSLSMHKTHSTHQAKQAAKHCDTSQPTLRVTRHVKYFLWSPMTMTLLRKGTSLLMWFSMGTGGMFSPPEVMISSGERGRRIGVVLVYDGQYT